MKALSRIALGTALALAGIGTAAAPGFAQAQAGVANLTKEERAAILPLQQAIAAKNFSAASAALPAAQAAARSSDARYIVASYQLRTGIGLNSAQIQSQAIDALLASGGVPAADLPEIYSNQGALATGLGDLKRAEAAYARLVEIAPNNAVAIANLAEVKNDLGKIPEAVTLIDRAIALTEASGQKVPESVYKRATKMAFDAKIAPQSLKFSRALAANYPTRENWRDAIFIHRSLAGADAGAAADYVRLSRATKALAGERDFLEAATVLNGAGASGEAKAGLDEGVAQKMVDPAKGAFKTMLASSGKQATTARAGLAGLQTKAKAAAGGTESLKAGDALLGSGDAAKAAELYQAAIQKGGIDAGLANSRLGIALALAGRKPEAEAAFRAVTGPRSDLAALWLAWLAQRG